MKKIFTTILLMLSAGLAQADLYCPAPEYETMSAVVRVVGDGVEGSGVVVAKNRILTAAHVVDGLDQINIIHKSAKRQATLVSTMPERDLALLIADTSNQKPIRMRAHWLRPDSEVWAIGFPLGGPQVAAGGQIEAYESGDVQTNASVNHGQSGGGLVACEDGQHILAGMIRAYGAVQQGSRLVRLENYSVHVSTEAIERFLDSTRLSATVLERFLMSSARSEFTAPEELVAAR